MSTTDNPAAHLRRNIVRIACVAALGGLLFGYDSAVINGAVDAIQSQFGVSDVGIGFAVASALLGAAVGAAITGRIADRIGRVNSMKIAAALFLISALGSTFSWDISSLVIFRVIGGLGVGAASVLAPAYIAETSPSAVRGRLGSLQQMAIVIGIFLSLLVDALLAALAGGSSHELWLGGVEAWRWMFLVMAIPSIAYGLLAFTIPESPRYLVATHREGEARSVLSTLLGKDQVELTITRIENSLGESSGRSFRDLLRPGGGIYPIVWVGLILSVLQQGVGINVIFYYSNILWQAVGFTENDAFTTSVITSVVNVLVTVVAILLVDKVGRKPLLLVGSIGMTVSLGALAWVFGTAPVVGGTPQLASAVFGAASAPIALVAANLFVVFFGASWGPVVWVLLGEMFPNRFRAAALSLAAGGQWIANWLVTMTFPWLKSVSLGLAYGIYTALALVSIVFVITAVKETKGKELEDMEADAN